jgi:acyl carrier protein
MTVYSRDQIREIILDALGAIAPEVEPSKILPDRPIRDQADIDSFDFLNLIIRLHETFRIDIPEKDYSELLTLNSAIDYLARRCTEND